MESAASELNLGALLPDLSTVMGWIELAFRVAVMAGPILLLGFGLVLGSGLYALLHLCQVLLDLVHVLSCGGHALAQLLSERSAAVHLCVRGIQGCAGGSLLFLYGRQFSLRFCKFITSVIELVITMSFYFYKFYFMSFC